MLQNANSDKINAVFRHSTALCHIKQKPPPNRDGSNQRSTGYNLSPFPCWLYFICCSNHQRTSRIFCCRVARSDSVALASLIAAALSHFIASVANWFNTLTLHFVLFISSIFFYINTLVMNGRAYCSPMIYFAAFSALEAAQTIALLSFFNAFSQPCI